MRSLDHTCRRRYRTGAPSGQIGEFLGEELVDALWGKSEIAATAETKAA